MNITMVTEETFAKEVLESDVPVLLDFGADWCGPCRVLEPVMEKIAADNVGKVKVLKIDADASPGISTRYRVRGLPTVIAFKGGEEHNRHLGATSAAKILDLLR